MQYRTNVLYNALPGACRVLPTLSYRAGTHCSLLHKAQPGCSLLAPEPGSYEVGLCAFLFVALPRLTSNDPHTMTADDGQFDSGMLNPGVTLTVTFEGLATLSYHCEIHPSTGVALPSPPPPKGEAPVMPGVTRYRPPRAGLWTGIV